MSEYPFSPEGRTKALHQMEKETVDLLIIGGGITGSGLAREATLRGLKVALVEKEDFGYGTSSRSSKLVHGGIRYLAIGDLDMVKESARERKVLQSIAPHLIHPIPFMMPLYKGDFRFKYRAAFLLFDRLAESSSRDMHRRLAPAEVRESAPFIRNKLTGGLVYNEYITDDARLTLLNALSAALHGAYVANYTEAISLRKESNRVTGAVVKDKFTGETYTINARVTVNATGPWVEDTLQHFGFKSPKRMLLSKGIHLLFTAERIPLQGAVILRSSDGKEGFAIRRWNYVYIGTTDVPTEESVDYPIADGKAIDQLLSLAQECFPELQLTYDDIISAWAGVRPLISEEGKTSREISRKDEIWTITDGFITVAGGKLTTYRKMAERILDAVAYELAEPIPPTKLSTTLTLPGGDIKEPFPEFKEAMIERLQTYEISSQVTERLTSLYGTKIDEIIALGEENPTWLEQLHPNVPALKAEVKIAIEREMAQTIEDVLDRRMGLLLFDKHQGALALETVAEIMANLLAWPEDRKQEEIETYQKRIKMLKSYNYNPRKNGY